MPARGAYKIIIGGGLHGLTPETTLADSASSMALPIPASGSVICAHSSTDTHPKGRNRGTTYKPTAETQAAQPQEWERLCKGRNQANSDSNL